MDHTISGHNNDIERISAPHSCMAKHFFFVFIVLIGVECAHQHIVFKSMETIVPV